MKQTADVVVVGGGIIGCSTAAELAKLGADVVLLERHEIAHGASGRNHGLIFYPQSPITEPLYRASLDMYRELEGSSTVELSLDDRPQGVVILVKDEDDWPAAESEARTCEAGGVAISKLDQRDLREAEPNLSHDYAGAWFINDGLRVDPAALTLAFALEARALGAEVINNTEVKQISVEQGKAKAVVTDDGVIATGAVVNASGPWASRLAMRAGTTVPITGARGWLVLTEAMRSVAKHLLVSAGWHLKSWDTNSKPPTLQEFSHPSFPPPADSGLLIQQNRSGHVLLGGSRLAYYSDDPDGQEASKRIVSAAVEALPALGDAAVEAVWSGVRPVSPDGIPLIGWHPEIEGLFVAGGHGGQGIMLGGGSGRLAAQMITAATSFVDPAPFVPARFG